MANQPQLIKEGLQYRTDSKNGRDQGLRIPRGEAYISTPQQRGLGVTPLSCILRIRHPRIMTSNILNAFSAWRAWGTLAGMMMI